MVEKPLCYIYQILAEIDSTIGRQVFKFQHTNIAKQCLQGTMQQQQINI